MPLPQLMPLLVAVTIARCPAPVKAQLDDLYRWQMSQQELRSPREIVSQKGRFTDGLYQKLWRAYALDPAMTPGRFLDFDPFSGTK